LVEDGAGIVHYSAPFIMKTFGKIFSAEFFLMVLDLPPHPGGYFAHKWPPTPLKLNTMALETQIKPSRNSN